MQKIRGLNSHAYTGIYDLNKCRAMTPAKFETCFEMEVSQKQTTNKPREKDLRKFYLVFYQ